MKATFIQTSLYWENREKNLLHIDQLISKMKEKTDLIVLPEMFTSGFSMNVEKIAEEGNREALDWMKSVSKDMNCVVTGSIAVEDNGIGIDARDTEKVFEPFKRLNYNLGGRGLGLYIVKAMIEALHGHITLTSKINQGSVFQVSIPRKADLSFKASGSV